MKYLLAIFTVVLLLFPSFVVAETKEIISEGTYNMGDGETPTVAESRALLQAKRTAVEEAGTYVESYSKTRNFQLTVDEIQVLASGIMEVEVMEKKRTVVGDGFNFWIKIKARVSTDKMEEMAQRVKEKSVVEDYKKIQEAYDKSQKDIEELKKQLAGAKSEADKKQVEGKITDEERLFEANEWSDKAYKHFINKEYNEAIEDYNKAITLNPDFYSLYTLRGLAYYYNGQYDNAIEDYSKAIYLNPRPIEYAIRGISYEKKGQYDKAIEDYNKIISLDPKYPKIYVARGLAYYYKGQYDKAIEDYNKAIVIDRNDAIAYQKRGSAYQKKDQLDKSIADYNKAIALNPNDYGTYRIRGVAYFYKGQYNRAIEDYNKAISLNPNDTETYIWRGTVYIKLGDINKFIIDTQKACDLGNVRSCELLQRPLIENGRPSVEYTLEELLAEKKRRSQLKDR